MKITNADPAELASIRDTLAKAQGFPYGPRERHARPGLGMTTCQSDVTATDDGSRTYELAVPDDLADLAVDKFVEGRISAEEAAKLEQAAAEAKPTAGEDVKPVAEPVAVETRGGK
jgi:hypothetical protein